MPGPAEEMYETIQSGAVLSFDFCMLVLVAAWIAAVGLATNNAVMIGGRGRGQSRVGCGWGQGLARVARQGWVHGQGMQRWGACRRVLVSLRWAGARARAVAWAVGEGCGLARVLSAYTPVRV